MIEGVIRTRVGYAGGRKKNPSYRSMGDHTETVQVDYDPQIITYAQLLQIFWDSHQFDSKAWSRQYMNAVFYHGQLQKKLAEQSLAAAAARRGIKPDEVRTAILPAGPFTYAELYHQKYALTRYHDIREFLEKIYPDPKSLADSSVATRLNAFLGTGFDWKAQRLQQELPSYGLPAKLEKQVLKAAQRR